MKLKGKKVLITAGGTREYIDDVRVLTNISSGKLGATIAEQYHKEGAEIYYLHGKGSVMPNIPNASYYEIKTVADLMRIMPTALQSYDIDIVVMTIAASDFTFRRDGAIKLKSNDPQAFVDFMRDTITTNPKVIQHIKSWSPEVLLVGFKFEVGQTHTQLRETALEAMEKNHADLMVANDKAEMERESEHIAYLMSEGGEMRCKGKKSIAKNLVEMTSIMLKNKD